VKGDNPVSIARRLGVSYEALLKLNKISDPRRLRLGQELQIPPKKAN
jgi:LysM repeat protein